MGSKHRKWFMLLLVFVMTFSIVACSSSNSGSNNGVTPNKAGNDQQNAPSNNSQKEAPAEPEVKGPPMVDGKYDPPVKLTSVRAVGPNVKFKEGEDINNNVFNDMVLERLGIDIDYLWTTTTLNDAFRTKLMLSLSSGEKFPDVINVESSIAQELIDSGMFQPVDELFEKYASDTYKLAASQAEEDWQPYLRDGRPYAIPSYNYNGESGSVMWIRQDWLDKLDLEAPKTISELEAVMEAFTNEDPDSNGQDDTTGLAIAMKRHQPKLTVAPQVWVEMTWILGAFGSLPGYWEKGSDDKLVYGSVTPAAKEGLATLRDWMEKGYLHREAGLHDEMKACELFIQGKAGIIVASTWAHAWPLNDTMKNNPEAVLAAYPIPTGDDGSLKIGGKMAHYNVTLINKDMEHPETFFTYQNYFYDEYADPKAGGPFEYGMAEGYDYAFIDGELKVKEAEIPGYSTVKELALVAQVARIPNLKFEILSELADGKEPVTPFEKQLALSPPLTLETAKIVLGQDEFVTSNLFMGAPTETIKEKQDLLQKLEVEAYNKIIYGELPLDAFDKFVEDWYSKGGEQVTTEVQEWYDTNVK